MSTTARFPNMDALRGIAAMAVLFHHLVIELAMPIGDATNLAVRILTFSGRGGTLGVLFFFLLSGYLITYRMLKERERTGALDLGRFYLRRILRIWPLYYVTLVLGFLVLPAIMRGLGQPFTESSSPLLFTLFMANYDILWNSPPSLGMLGVHWSVCVEEQFYLIWPLLFLLVGRRLAFCAIVAVVVVASEVFVVKGSHHEAYFHLFGNLRYLGLGALLAVLVVERGAWIRALLARVAPLFHSVALVLGALVLFGIHTWAFDYPARMAVAHVATLCTFCYVLVQQSQGDGRSLQLDRIPALRWLGERSYGIYLLHMLALEIARGLFHNDPAYFVPTACTTVALTVVLAHFSYRYLESPFLRLKTRFT